MTKFPTIGALSCAILATLGSAQLAGAQSGPVSRIRLIPVDRDAKTLVGAPVSFGADTVQLVLRGRSDTLKVAMGSLRGIDELRGRRSNWDRGAMIGAVVLGVAGAIATPILAEAMDDGGSSTIGAQAIGVGFGAGAIAGALLGAGIGALTSRDHWTARPTLTVRQVADQGSVHLGLALGFSF